MSISADGFFFSLSEYPIHNRHKLVWLLVDVAGKEMRKTKFLRLAFSSSACFSNVGDNNAGTVPVRLSCTCSKPSRHRINKPPSLYILNKIEEQSKLLCRLKPAQIHKKTATLISCEIPLQNQFRIAAGNSGNKVRA